MGFDVSKFIAKVEEFASKLPGSTSKVDGNLDAFEKASIFKNEELVNELTKAVKDGEYSEADAKAIFGLELSGTTAANAPRRAAGTGEGGDDGTGGEGDGEGYSVTGGIVNFIYAPTNINIQINISTEIKNEINQNLSGTGDGPGGANIQALMDLLVQLLGEGGTVQEFILYIFEQFSTQLGLDLGNIQELLKQILEKLDQQEQTINKLTEYLIESMKKNFNLLVAMGLNIDKLVEIAQQGNADNLDILGKIYSAIMDLTGKFEDFTEVEQQQFNAVMGMLNQGNINLEQVLALLNVIKNDSSQNNETSQKILDAIINGNKEILAALTKIQNEFANFGPEIMDKLDVIISKIGGGGVAPDLTALLDLLHQMLEKLNAIEKNTGENKEYSKAILEAIANFGAEISDSLNVLINQAGQDSEKMDALIALLQKLDANNEQRNKAILDAIAALGVDVIEALDKLEIHIDDDVLQEVIDAINENTVATNNQGQNTTFWLQTLFGLMQAMYDKIGTGGGGTGGGGITQDQLKEMLNNLVTNLHNAFAGDLADIMAMLQQILEAIKNHDVNVIITYDESTGQATVTTNEGENDNNDVIGALFSRKVGVNEGTGIADTSTKTGVLKDGKYTRDAINRALGTDLRDPVYIVKGGRVYTLKGTEVPVR